MSYNKLRGLRAYLSGPIEFCDNGGTKWRDEITPALEEMGVIVYDPTKLSNDMPEAERNRKMATERDWHNWDTVRELAKPMRNFDLRLVDKADFLIVYINPDIQMCGTWEEVFDANRSKKPILQVWNGGIERVSGWMFGVMPPYYYQFRDFKQVEDYLKKIDTGEITPDLRWVFVDADKAALVT